MKTVNGWEALGPLVDEAGEALSRGPLPGEIGPRLLLYPPTSKELDPGAAHEPQHDGDEGGARCDQRRARGRDPIADVDGGRVEAG